MKFRALLISLPALWLAACSGTGGDTAGETAAAALGADATANATRVKSGDMGDDDFSKMQDKYGDYNTYMNQDGTGAAGSGKEFAGFRRDNPEFKGRWENKEYKQGDYRKKSLWGDRDYVTKVYGTKEAGGYRKDSRFGGKQAGEGGVSFREGDKSYGTGNYATGAAREGRGERISKVSDAETDERRRLFTEPDIIPWQARDGLTVDDTNRMLGR